MPNEALKDTYHRMLADINKEVTFGCSECRASRTGTVVYEMKSGGNEYFYYLCKTCGKKTQAFMYCK